MQSILVTNYSYIVSRKTARLGLKYIDLESIKLRAKKGFRKRTSHSYSSRDIIHIGGYDKPKPFGTYVHGGIDGYSQKVIWLEVCSTNNNQFVTTLYYVNYQTEEMKT